MRGLAAAFLVLVLSATVAFAQTPIPPAGSQATPEQTVPPAPAAPAVESPAPFPSGAKVAYVNVPGIFSLSAIGKSGQAEVQVLTQTKQVEMDDRTKALQAAQQKLQTGGTLMNEQARAQLQRDIDRQTTELERFRQDAEVEVSELGQNLQTEFEAQLLPLLRELSTERGLQMLFSAADAGLIWAEPGLDLTLEAVERLNAATAK